MCCVLCVTGVVATSTYFNGTAVSTRVALSGPLTDECAAPSLSLQGRDARVDPFMGYNVKLLVHSYRMI